MIQAPEHCPLCNGQTLSHREAFHTYDLWRCAGCQGMFWWPFQNPGAEWYQNDSRYHGRNQDPLLDPVDTHQLFLQEKEQERGTLLDVGCGTGNFLAAAQKTGYRVSGIDFDPDAVRVAREIFHLEDVHVGDVDQLSMAHKTYNKVTFFEVLEHLDQPNAFLKSVKGLLSPGGCIALSVPDAEAWHPFQLHDKPPRHLTRWTKEALRLFLQRHGFQVVRIVQKPVTLQQLITKFHFWTQSYLSFNLVSRVRQTQVSSQGSRPAGIPSRSVVWAKRLAKMKDWMLFFFPAVAVWMYLQLAHKHSSGLYVFAKRVD